MTSVLTLSAMSMLLLTASWTDFRERRIPNLLVFVGIVVAFAINTVSQGATGAGASSLGAMIGLAVFLPLYAFGKMGGGDVKLLAMVGAFLGPEGVVWAALWSAMAGGVLALLWILFKMGMRTGFYSAVGSLALIRLPGVSVLKTSEDSVLKLTMPYALAIAAGSLIAAWQISLG